MMLNVCAVGTDGKTSWRRVKGCEFNIRMLGFVEQAMYKLPMKGPEKITRGNAVPNFKQAPYIGFSKTNYGHRFIGQEDKLVTPRRAVKLPVEQKWNMDELKKITPTPLKPNVGRERSELSTGKQVEAPVEETVRSTARRL